MPSISNRHYTPLRYPGGKAPLAPYVKAILERNNLMDGHYVEAYAGGAAIGIELLLHEYVSHVHINDLSRPLYAFWTSILDHTDEVVRKIHNSRLTVRCWDRHKRILQNSHEHDDLDVGFAFFYLNRTNRSGIQRGGIIGGRNQRGKWKMDARYNASGLAARIEAIASLRSRISVYNEDALAFLRRVLPSLPRATLLYLDPPYYLKGKDLYLDYYSHEDHACVAKFVSQLSKKWIVSYDDVREIRGMYSRFRGIGYELGYSARDRRTGREVMYFCDALEIPRSVHTFTPVKRIAARR